MLCVSDLRHVVVGSLWDERFASSTFDWYVMEAVDECGEMIACTRGSRGRIVMGDRVWCLRVGICR